MRLRDIFGVGEMLRWWCLAKVDLGGSGAPDLLY